jgi:hypothetical protein
MAEKQMVSAKIGGKTYERLDSYADREEISRSQAIDRMLKQGLDVEESDMRLVPVQTDGGTKIENRLDSVQEELEEQNQHQNYLNLALAVTVLWFVVYFTLGLSPVWTAITGIPLVAVLAYLVHKEWS